MPQNDIIKFLSLNGLTQYDDKIKEYVNALKAEDIAVEWDEQDPVSTSTDVQGALDEIFNAIGNIAVIPNTEINGLFTTPSSGD